MNQDDFVNFPKEVMDALPDLFSKQEAEIAIRLRLRDLEEKGKLYSLSPEEVALLEDYRKQLKK